MENLQRELAKLCEAIEKNVVKKPMRALALDKLGNYLRGMEKPKRETLDRLSLLAGFQDWESFRDAIHGDADGSTNYRGDTAERFLAATASQNGMGGGSRQGAVFHRKAQKKGTPAMESPLSRFNECPISQDE